MFEVTATILIGLATLAMVQVTIRRERRLIEARRRRAQHATEFETQTGMYAPNRLVPRQVVGEQSSWGLAR